MSAFVWVGVVCVVALIVGLLADRRARYRERTRLAAAVRAQAIAESIPNRGVTVRGGSRDRQLSGKARRRARRVG